MKILITTDTFYPMINGVVISTNNLYRELKGLGHEVRILTLSNTKKGKIDGDIYYLKAFKVKVYPDAKVKHLIVGELEKSLIEWKPDVIHSQTEFSTLIAARYIAKKTGAIHMHTYHTMYEEYLNYLFKGKLIRPKMVGKLVEVLFSKMDGVIVPTQKMKDCLVRFGVDRPLYIVPTGLQLDRFVKKISQEERNYLQKKYDLTDDRLLVYVGRVGEEKNIDEIIRYFQNTIKEHPLLKLLVVGGGPHLEALRELVDKLEMGQHVIFTGMISPDEIYKYYQLGHIFVTASRSETQGLTYIEAMASGVPVICRKDPCVDGLVMNGVNGYTYVTEKDFQNCINKFISDEEHRQSSAKMAKEKAMEYSSQIFGERVSSIYEDLLSSSKKSRALSQIDRANHIFNRLF